MIIEGHVVSPVNVRSSPNADISSNILMQMQSGDRFEGSEFVLDSHSKKWIKLTKINSNPVSVCYIASYISAVVVDSVINDPDPIEAEIPYKLTYIEHFKTSAGVDKTRTIVWENPIITEE